MRIRLRVPESLRCKMLEDLARSHPVAYERVGFLYCKQTSFPGGKLLLAYRYEAIFDNQYIEDATVGAKFDGSAIRNAMQVALTDNVSVFHVHLHDHQGVPMFSTTDQREMGSVIPCFVNVRPERVHGALVLSRDSATAKVWGVELQRPGTPTTSISFVGSALRIIT